MSTQTRVKTPANVEVESRPAPLPGALAAIWGTLVGVTGASLILIPVGVIGVVRSLPAGGAGAGTGGSGTAVVAEVAAAPAAAAAPTGAALAELNALRMLPAGNAENGNEHFAAYCAACHGPDGKGKANLGKDLIKSPFVKDQSDAQLIAFIKRGRDVNDPLNTTKVPMPPKAGNPAFTDGELNDVVAYMRQLQKQG